MVSRKATWMARGTAIQCCVWRAHKKTWREVRGGQHWATRKRQWGLCKYVIVHTIWGGSPVILWISLGGKPKWLPLKFGYHDVMRTSPLRAPNCLSFVRVCACVRVRVCYLKKKKLSHTVPKAEVAEKAGPLEAILVTFGRTSSNFFRFERSWKIRIWHNFCDHAHAQCWSPWRLKIVEKSYTITRAATEGVPKVHHAAKLLIGLPCPHTQWWNAF